jgi:hypothetical protein
VSEDVEYGALPALAIRARDFSAAEIDVQVVVFVAVASRCGCPAAAR